MDAAGSIERPPIPVSAALAVGIITGASAALLTRYAQSAGAPSLLIAFVRLALASLILTPFVIARHWHDLRMIRRREWLITILAGLWMALQFVLWNWSLEYVGVLIASVLVTSSPIWAALIEVTFMKMRLTRYLIIGLGAVILGNMLIALAGGQNSTMGSNPLLGAAFAISAALAIAIQRTLSRQVRIHLRLLPFVWLLYSCAALTLLVAIVLTRTPLIGYQTDAYVWMLLITLFPQLIAHSVFTYALRYLPATMISLAVQVEPSISAAAAFFLFAEVPLPLQLVGSAVILVGVTTATLGGKRRSAHAAASLS
jgi:drug/metabolite transporter (DMT)-like permease